jgi:hypothetical protein
MNTTGYSTVFQLVESDLLRGFVAFGHFNARKPSETVSVFEAVSNSVCEIDNESFDEII